MRYVEKGGVTMETGAAERMFCAATAELAGLGVTVTFQVKGEKGMRHPGDILGTLPAGSAVYVTVRILKNVRFPAVVAFGRKAPDGGNEVEVLRPASERGRYLIYEWRVPFTSTRKGAPGLPVWPYNRIYLLSEASGGKFSLALLGIVCQELRNLAWIEIPCRGQAYLDEEGLQADCPSELWSELLQFLYREGRFGKAGLPPAKRKAHVGPAVSLAALNVKTGTGTVQYWNPFSGTGHAHFRTDEGELVAAKLHFSKFRFEGEQGFKMISAGQRIKGRPSLQPHTQGPKKGADRLQLDDVELVDAD